ncbi:hypothetical protein J3B02_001026 [Coemansia erecta]|nr:hypothetical protein J3B02_001026 [Coemansia erecta]
MDVFPTRIADPSLDNSPSSNNSASGREMLATAAQETAIQVATTIIHQHEVIARLSRYRSHYEAEIVRQNERMADIERALANFGRHGEASDSRRRAMEVLGASLDDAKKSLFDARLAKARLELEISQWAVRVSGAEAENSNNNN